MPLALCGAMQACVTVPGLKLMQDALEKSLRNGRRTRGGDEHDEHEDDDVVLEVDEREGTGTSSPSVSSQSDSEGLLEEVTGFYYNARAAGSIAGTSATSYLQTYTSFANTTSLLGLSTLFYLCLVGTTC